MVNAGHVTQIIEMGFSKTVAEKALFLTQGGVEKAMDWINEHMEDEDFNEELVIVGSNDQPTGYKMTLEERQAKAVELQREIRAKQAAKEKQRAIENEAARKK